jgi:uncharacterized ferredoxin-like protein
LTKYDSNQVEIEATRMTAMLMATAARTAPKARGVDSIKTLVLDREDVEKLAIEMERKAQNMPLHVASVLRRDAGNVRASICVLLIGVSGLPKKIEKPLDCGACGYDSCERMVKIKRQTNIFTGPTCLFQAIDLGIALGSAAKLASELNVDNRMMYSIGIAAREKQLLDSDIIIGIPLSVTGKSPYFDRQ